MQHWDRICSLYVPVEERLAKPPTHEQLVEDLCDFFDTLRETFDPDHTRQWKVEVIEVKKPLDR